MPPPLPRCSRSAYLSLKNRPSVSAFPETTIGSACTSTFSRIARRLLALRPAHSRGHQLRDRYPGASDISSPPCLPRLLPAGAVAGRGLHPLDKRRLVTAHVERCHSPRHWRHTRCGRSPDFPKPPDIQWTKAPDRVTQIRIPSRRDQLLRCRARSRRAAAVPKPVERLGVVSPAAGVARPAIEACGKQYFCLVDTPGTQRRVD